MQLTVVSQTASKLVVSWTPPASSGGVLLGYEFLLDGKRISNTWDASTSKVTFGIPDKKPHTYSVVPLMQGDVGVVSVNQPAPPVGPLNPVPPPKTGAYIGAYVEGKRTNAFYYPNEVPWSDAPLVDPGTSNSLDRFERDAGKAIKLMMFGRPHPVNGGTWASDMPYFTACPLGSIPVLDWMTSPGQADGVLLTDITAGKYDTQLTAWANGAKAWNQPFVVRLDCEMNGAWYGYGVQARKNPADFVAMWQHMHKVVASIAPNISWHWCPNVDPESIQTPLEQLYPGDAYVDWIGMTGYNHGKEATSWIFDSTYSRLIALSKLPIMLGEIGSVDTNFPGDKVKFINELLGAMINGKYQQVKGFCWFNWRIDEGSGMWDWPIQSSPESLGAFKTVMANPYFVGR